MCGSLLRVLPPLLRLDTPASGVVEGVVRSEPAPSEPLSSPAASLVASGCTIVTEREKRVEMEKGEMGGHVSCGCGWGWWRRRW